MDRTESEMAQALNAFATTRDATQMQRAFEAAEAAERDLEAPLPTQRRQALDRRLRLFVALDAALDAEWDVSKVPVQGVAPPASHRGMVRGTGEVDPIRLSAVLQELMNLSPRGIRLHLELSRPIYARTAAYGHFGREPDAAGGFSWERTDLVDELRAAF